MWHYNRVAPQLFLWFCMCLLGAFSNLLAFGSVKIAKTIILYKRSLVFFINQLKIKKILKKVPPERTKDRDPWLENW